MAEQVTPRDEVQAVITKEETPLGTTQDRITPSIETPHNKTLEDDMYLKCKKALDIAYSVRIILMFSILRKDKTSLFFDEPSKICEYAICNGEVVHLVYIIPNTPYYITICGNVIHESSLKFISKDIYDSSNKLELTWKNSTHFVPFSIYEICNIDHDASEQQLLGRFVAKGRGYWLPNSGEEPKGFWWIEPGRE